MKMLESWVKADDLSNDSLLDLMDGLTSYLACKAVVILSYLVFFLTS